MSTSTFTISCTGASLVEVIGDGPYTDRNGGLFVLDGATATAPVDLLNGWVRSWRVDAPSSAQAIVAVTDSPYGAFVQLRRYVPPSTPIVWRRPLIAVRQWIARTLVRVTSIDALASADQPSCAWRDIGGGNQTQVQARGGDLVVVTFETP